MVRNSFHSNDIDDSANNKDKTWLFRVILTKVQHIRPGDAQISGRGPNHPKLKPKMLILAKIYFFEQHSHKSYNSQDSMHFNYI